MSAVLEPDVIATPEAEVLDYAAIHDGKAVVAYSRTEAGLAELRTELQGRTYDLATVKGNDLARADRQRCVKLRTALDAKRKSFKAPALEYGRLVDAEAKRITDEILKLEKPIDDAIKADEDRREKEREAKRQAESARVQKHRDGIATIRRYAAAAGAADMTSARLATGIERLKAMTFSADQWEEFAGEATLAQQETLAALEKARDELIAKEAEAARLEAQRLEQERIAAEQAEVQRRLDEQAAELRRQQEAIAEQQRQASAPPAPVDSEEQPPQQVLKAEPATADATDRGTAADVSPRGGAMGAGQAAAAAPIQEEPATLKLGEIADAFGVGLTAAFLAELGFQPARTEKRSLLFTITQARAIQQKLAAHVLAVRFTSS